MSEQRDREFVQHSIDTGLESMQGNPFLAQRIMNQERTEQPVMKKKISFAFILAIILLIVSIATAVAGAINEDFNAWLYRIWPEMALKLMPVNMSCEKNGILMEVISAVADGSDLYVTYSMEDLKGDRLSTESSPVMYINHDYSSMWEASFEAPMWDEATGKIIFGEHFNYDNNVPAEGYLRARIPSFTSYKETDCIDLFPYLEQYGSQVKTTVVPQDAQIIFWYESYDQPDWSDNPEDAPGPIPDSMHVIDPANSLEIPLAETVYLSGIGMVDGQLHVQLHYVNHQKTVLGKNMNRIVYRPDQTDVVLRDIDSEYWSDPKYMDSDNFINKIDCIGWGTQPGDPDTPEWVELLFAADAADLSPEVQEFCARIVETIPLQGVWAVDIPARLIRETK